MMMLLRGTARLTPIAPAAPAWLVVEPDTSLIFSWGRHDSIQDGQPLALRLFVVTDAPGMTQWSIDWRWSSSVESMGGPNPPFTSLANLVRADPPLLQIDHPGPVGGELQLNASEFFRLSPDGENRVGEYLMVRITLLKREVDSNRLGLLLAELAW